MKGAGDKTLAQMMTAIEQFAGKRFTKFGYGIAILSDGTFRITGRARKGRQWRKLDISQRSMQGFAKSMINFADELEKR